MKKLIEQTNLNLKYLKVTSGFPNPVYWVVCLHRLHTQNVQYILEKGIP